MATNPFFSGRIPQFLFDHVEKFREESGEQKTEILIKALAQYTNLELEDKSSEIPSIRREFNTIYARLEDAFTKIEHLEKLLNIDKKKIISDNGIDQLELLGEELNLTSNNNQSETMILSSVETIKITGASQSTLSVWKNKNLLPKIYTNKKSNQTFEIDLEKDEHRKTLWRVRLLDN